MMKLHIHRVDFVATTLWYCKCGAVAKGDTVRQELDVDELTSDAFQVQPFPVSSQHIPIGWSSSTEPQENVYICPACIAKSNEEYRRRKSGGAV